MPYDIYITMTSRDDLDALRLKYEEMLRMRLEHERGEETDPRRAMTALADRFPGSLREIDELSISEIQSRIDALALASRDATMVQLWMRATARFHALLRGALCAKRWLSKGKALAAFETDAEAFRYAADAREWANDLAHLAHPPRGRITELVFERLARELRITAKEARHLVFGLSRRERREGRS
jgi:hypothetical protein